MVTKLPLTLLLMIVIASTVSFLPVQEAKASIEIAYDDGIYTGGGIGWSYLGVSFTAPSAGLYLIQVKLWAQTTGPFTIFVTQSDHTTVITSFPITITTVDTWETFSVPGGGVAVPQNFFVIVGTSDIYMKLDSAAGVGTTYWGASLATMASYIGDLMLRAIVDTGQPTPVTPALVGGVVLPTNTLAMLTPYLALAGLIAAVSVIVIKKRI